MDKDLYEVLGVSRDADQDSIKKAYRKLAMQFHPDKNPGNKEAEDKFKEAARAYEVLSHQEKRARYDRFGMAGVDGQRGGGAGQGFHDVSDIFSAFGDIFGDFFGGAAGGARGGRAQRNRPRRGSDLRYGIEVDLEEVLTGKEADIEFDVDENCGTCAGSGAAKGAKAETCSTCGGSGQVVMQQGFFSVAQACPKCRGQGQIITDPCKTCKGKGRSPVHRKLSVNIPKGVSTGTQLRMTGEGEGGYLGGGPGDLYVEIYVRPHKKFQRQDEHLVAPLEISYLQALLGAQIEVETLSGKTEAEIPKGAQDGDLIKLAGQGLPSLRSARSGDLVFQVQVKFPKKLDKKEEELLRQIAEIKGESVKKGKAGLFK